MAFKDGAGKWILYTKQKRFEIDKLSDCKISRQFWHREDGPALYWEDNESEVFFKQNYWYQNGLLHRENGPAVVRWDKEEWWYYGIEITKSVRKWMKENGYEIPFTDKEKFEFFMRF